MKTFEKEELQEIANGVLDANKHVDTVHVSADGYAFLPANYQDGRDHTLKNKIELHEFKREAIAPEDGKPAEDEGEPKENAPEGEPAQVDPKGDEPAATNNEAVDEKKEVKTNKTK